MVVFTALGGIFPPIWEDIKSALVSTSPDIAPYVGNYIVLLVVFFIIVFIIFRQRIVPDLLNIREGTQLNSASFIFSLAFTLLVFFSGVLKPLAAYSATIILLLIVLLIVYGIMKLIGRAGGISSGRTPGGGGGGGHITIEEVERREKETEKDVKKIREDEGRIKKGFNALRGHLADFANSVKSGGYRKETHKKIEEKAKLIENDISIQFKTVRGIEKYFDDLEKNLHPRLKEEAEKLKSHIVWARRSLWSYESQLKTNVRRFLSTNNYKGLEEFIKQITTDLETCEAVIYNEIVPQLERISKESEKAFEEEKEKRLNVALANQKEFLSTLNATKGIITVTINKINEFKGKTTIDLSKLSGEFEEISNKTLELSKKNELSKEIQVKLSGYHKTFETTFKLSSISSKDDFVNFLENFRLYIREILLNINGKIKGLHELRSQLKSDVESVSIEEVIDAEKEYSETIKTSEKIKKGIEHVKNLSQSLTIGDLEGKKKSLETLSLIKKELDTLESHRVQFVELIKLVNAFKNKVQETAEPTFLDILRLHINFIWNNLQRLPDAPSELGHIREGLIKSFQVNIWQKLIAFRKGALKFKTLKKFIYSFKKSISDAELEVKNLYKS